MLDKTLQPLSPRLPTYFSNSNQAIYHLNQTLRQLRPVTNSATRYYLVTVDASSMHANILRDEVIANIKSSYLKDS